MQSREIRKRFLDFFGKNGHKIVESDLLVPRNDPTLLFTGAGMNQFKDQFMGKNISYRRAATCQKCLRTGDIENVGRTPRHHTFFEMLGNFSFGDYFKKEAIRWGWLFMTEELAIPSQRLWISVYKDDDESYDIWVRDIGVPEKRIVRLGAKDNFWPSNAPKDGPNGPCGPCSEIFYDWSEIAGCGKPGCDPSCDCGRFVEVWNLVFTEFERKPDGALVPLPNKNIDTGMGLERITSVMQDVRTNFETDLFSPIVEEIRKTIGPAAEKMAKADLYLIADHIRAVTFSIGDGVSPSNENRGYVIRKLIRRAYLRNPGKQPFMYRLVPKVARMMNDVYPDTAEKAEHISAIVEEEEKKFSGTLEATMPILEEMLLADPGRLAGDKIFKLADTYGLPVDVIEETAERRDIKLDMAGFESLMEERREESRRSSDMTSDFIFQPDLFKGAPKPAYSGELPLESTLEFILKGDSEACCIGEGETGEIILSPQSSSFYAESGGQSGDTGTITRGASVMKVINTFETDGRKVHYVRVEKGRFEKKDKVVLSLDEEKKRQTARNHTATHLLQSALRGLLGDHVKQSGSAVDNKRLRFDFTHLKKLSERELVKIEETVNGWINDSIAVTKTVKAIEDARKEGALSFFGEKYGDSVRVVTAGGASKEFCGGTHVDNTADIGLFKITVETSIASGVRRIEAVTGEAARKWLRDRVKEALREVEGMTSSPGKYIGADILEISGKIAEGTAEVDASTVKEYEERIKPAFLAAVEALRKESKEKEKAEGQEAFNRVTRAIDEKIKYPETVNGVRFVWALVSDADMELVRRAARYAEKKVDGGIVFLGGRAGDKAAVICAVTGHAAVRGFNARDIVNMAAVRINGKGGGKDTFAQAGGSDPSGLEAAVEDVRRFLAGKN